MAPQRINQRPVARQRFERVGEQQASHVAANAGNRGAGVGNDPAHLRFHLRGHFFGDDAPVHVERDLAGHHIGVGAALDAPDVDVGVANAADVRANRLVERVLPVQRVQDRRRALQCVDAAVRNGRVRHRSVHLHFELKAAAMRGHDLVAEASGDQQVGFDDVAAQQQAGAEFSAEFFVVGEQQFDRAFQRCVQALQRAHCEGVGREIALAHCRRAAIEFAVHHFAAVRVVRPAVAGRHHVAVRIEHDDRPARSVRAPDQQIDQRLEPGRLGLRIGHRVLFGVQPEAGEQLRGALRVRRVVARRRVGGHAHQLLQKAHLFVEVRVDPGVELFVVGHRSIRLMQA